MKRISIFVVTTIYAALILCPQLFSQNDNKDPSQLGSLVRVPDTTAVYVATMNHRAMFDAVFDSKAWKAIRKSQVSRNMKKAYRRGKAGGYEEYGAFNLFAMYLKAYGDYYDNMVVQSGLRTIEPIFENEIFVYLDHDAIPMLKAINSAIDLMSEDLKFDESGESVLTPEVEKALGAAFKNVDVPTLIIGARVSDLEYRDMIELAQGFIESSINEQIKDEVDLRDRFKTVEDENQRVLFLTLDMNSIPIEQQLEEAGDIKNALKDKSMTFAFGIRKDIVFAGMAATPEKLMNFGSGNKLVDLPELKKLKQAMDSNLPITSVSYVSEEVASNLPRLDRFFVSLGPAFAKGFAQEMSLGEEEEVAMRKQITEGISEFTTEWKSMAAAPAMSFSFSHLSNEGIQSYQRIDTVHPLMDGSKTLPILNYVSEETLAFSTCRFKDLGQLYRFISKWGGKMIDPSLDQVKEAAILTRMQKEGFDPLISKDELDTEERARYEKVRTKAENDHDVAEKVMGELAATSNSIVLENVLPAIKGQETAIFIDMVTGPNQWHEQMTDYGAALPVPSIVLLQKHSNQQSIVDAYRSLEKKLKSTAEELESIQAGPQPEQLEEMLSSWKLEDSEFGWTLTSSPFPEELGFDPSIVSKVVIGEDVLAYNFPGLTIERLFLKKPNSIFGPAVEAQKQPSTAASFYNNRLLLQTISKWWDAAQNPTNEDGPEEEPQPKDRNLLEFSRAEIDDHYQRVWNFMDCWRGYSSRSYIESGGTVTESLYKFEDIQE